MQTTLALLLALCVLPAASSSLALSQAKHFLSNHEDSPPQQDELAELNQQNPEAYALVKALLTKRSLGLLDPKHPTASFAKVQEQTVEQGPEAFAISPEEQAHAASAMHQDSGAPEVAVPYATVQGEGHHDVGLNWKPQSAGMDDETMVQNVLGAVAELKGKKAGFLTKEHSTTADNTLAADEQSFAVAPEPAKPVAAPAAPKVNSYLASFTDGIRANVEESQDSTIQRHAAEYLAPQPADQHENSYLKGLDLGGTDAAPKHKKASQVQGSSVNALSSFSWDDSQLQVEQHAQAKIEQAVSKQGGKLLSWLDMVKTPAPVRKVAVAAKVAPSNPYLMDLS